MKPLIKLGTAGIPLSCEKRDTVSGIKKVAELGLQALEVEFVRGVSMSLPKAKEVGKAAAESGIGLSIHAPYYINLASGEKAIIAASKKRVLDSLERGAAMDAKIVVVHAGYYGKNRDEAVKMIAEACAEIAERIEKNKWDIIFGIETSGKQGQFGPLEEIVALCEKSKHCAPVIDFAHLFARQAGIIDYGKVLDSVKHYRHLHCHFSGINYSVVGVGKGNERNHEPIGKPPFEPLAEELLKRGADITIICESPLLENDALKMKNALEKLEHSF
ncbi:MAG: TIM barrel protein [Candidatus Aenigmatarchaeota archaeon]